MAEEPPRGSCAIKSVSLQSLRYVVDTKVAAGVDGRGHQLLAVFFKKSGQKRGLISLDTGCSLK